MSDLVRALFASFDSEGSLQTAVAEHREESLYLEFKRKQDTSHPEIEDSDRRNFSKAVSAFANADGGVLIFGVATGRQTPGQPDRADALMPITNAHGFAGRLADSILNTTQPPVDAVEFRVIESTAQPRTGYVACLVPASDTVPHHAVLADREYYRRTASGSRRLEHIDLEDMFGRRPRPVLEVELERRSAENGQDR